MIGIGLNLNQDRFPADLPNPVSLRQLTGRTYDLRTELVLLRDALKKTASLLDSQEGRSELSRDFDAFVFRKED
jgi:BirA family biotin operon repressor/biotin-[acetyl-CoA-carboxylase] ligase